MAKAKEKQETKGQRASQGKRQRESEKQSSQAMQTTGKSSGGEPSDITRRDQYAPSLWSGSPFTFMRRFSEEMDRLFGDFGFGRGLSRFGELESSIWSPQVEVFERGGQLIVRADLPGLTKDDINVDIREDALVIRGERREEREEDEEGYYRTERSYGSFYRQIPLPEGVKSENANATFRNGVLEITMEAPERAEPQRGSRRLEIREDTQAEEQPAERGRAKAAGR
ncbi:MAG TPA: Hsp20/alpha crystallin family protein [Pyrinomonadaceae bacterium]